MSAYEMLEQERLEHGKTRAEIATLKAEVERLCRERKAYSEELSVTAHALGRTKAERDKAVGVIRELDERMSQILRVREQEYHVRVHAGDTQMWLRTKCPWLADKEGG